MKPSYYMLLPTAKRMYEIAGAKCEVKKALSRAEMEKAKSDGKPQIIFFPKPEA